VAAVAIRVAEENGVLGCPTSCGVSTGPLVRCLLFSAAFLAAECLRAAEDANGSGLAASAAPTISSVESRMQRLREAKDIESDLRDELIETYAKAIKEIRAADEFAAKAAEWVKASAAAPTDVEKVKADLAKVSGQTSAPGPSPNGSVPGDLAKMQEALTRAE